MSADSTHIHDILGVGIGPFGLGLAALSEPLDDVTAVLDLVRATGHGILAGRDLEDATTEGGAA